MTGYGTRALGSQPPFFKHILEQNTLETMNTSINTNLIKLMLEEIGVERLHEIINLGSYEAYDFLEGEYSEDKAKIIWGQFFPEETTPEYTMEEAIDKMGHSFKIKK